MKNAERKIISSTKKDGKIVAQQVTYTEKGYSITKHEKVFEYSKGLVSILGKKSKGINKSLHSLKIHTSICW